jgi:hypothetical protein
MDEYKLTLDFLNPLGVNTAVYRSLSELLIAKMEAPQLSIRAAKKWGILNLSSSFHYNQLEVLGNLFIRGFITLKDFLPFFSSDTKICDATYLKREGKKVYATKRLRNYNIGCYELLQDVLFTVERYKGVNFIYDFEIINHNKRHRTKPQEIMEAIKTGKIKKRRLVCYRWWSKSGETHARSEESWCKSGNTIGLEFCCCPIWDRIQKGRRIKQY